MILLVGAGPMAVAHGHVLRALGRQVICIGRGADSAARFTAETGIPVQTGGISAWMTSPNRDQFNAAVVAVSLDQLHAVTKTLVASGIRRIMVEKPAGLTKAEITALDDAARSAGTDIFLAYNRRFYNSVITARRMIAEDGGVSSFFFDFTEVAARTVIPGRSRTVLANWFLANSSHVVDLAFHLAGRPRHIDVHISGQLDWHPPGARFSGSGITQSGAIFSYLADWTAPGRWGIDIRTGRRRIILQPMESLKQQEHGSFTISDIDPSDDLDIRYKPGLYRQMQAFLSEKPQDTALQSLSNHLDAVCDDFLPLIGVKS